MNETSRHLEFCANCDSEKECVLVDYSDDPDECWFEAYRCPTCGEQFEINFKKKPHRPWIESGK
jgi:hypothetical protein